MNKNDLNDDNINYQRILTDLFKVRKDIFKSAIISFAIGLVFAVLSPNKYTSKTTFTPQSDNSDISSNLSSFSGLASLAGVNLSDNSSNQIPPSLYPQVIESVPFKLKLLDAEVNFNDNKLSFREYLKSKSKISKKIVKYTIGLPSLLLEQFNNEVKQSNNNINIYQITKEDVDLFEELDEIVKLDINEKEGFITLSISDEDKVISSIMAKKAESLLQEKVISFKIKSSKELLDFSVDQYEKNKMSFEKLQDDIAIFKDKNQNISSLLYQNTLDRLNNELSIVRTVTQQLASQVEQAKLQVNKNTPVFKIIKPVTVPYKKSSPNRISIILTFILLGVTLSSTYFLVKDFILKYYYEIKNS